MYKKQTYATNQFSAYYRQIDVFADISKLKYFYLLTNIYIYNIREEIIMH